MGSGHETRARRAEYESNASAVFSYVFVYYLCRLYKLLGDYDVLHGVFSRQIGTKSITRKALEAEERRDYFEALRLYKEVSGRGGHLTSYIHEFKIITSISSI